ncbi:unnamed protein product [Oppiella nova]|uniref:ABC transporter domain-containing protein n=1 Tax=Oppiella nova TaxID=334625 RepID=A0A7R9M336_9ACAR|nr:unnamed protein product [Oppiella nova]CAG2169745.1 unnamed protein product [Oppiella nova]
MYFPDWMDRPECSEVLTEYNKWAIDQNILTFLELGEMEPKTYNTKGLGDLAASPKTNAKPKVIVNNISAKWSEGNPNAIIQNISFNIKPGDLLAVIGPVGSGKSSLIMSILNELPVLEGSIQTVGIISYASQEAWSFNNSVRNNILFGSEYDEHRYRRVVDGSPDIPFGDKTLVGEKGVSLSGGQKARITLARALYRNSDIVLMDDPLSAVDTSVVNIYFISNAINSHMLLDTPTSPLTCLSIRCIVEYLSDKIRILVTHEIQFIRKSTQILVLSSEGRCLGLGSYDELQSQEIYFMAILKDVEREAEHDKQTPTPNETLVTESINDGVRKHSRTTSVAQTKNFEVSDIMGDEKDYSHESRIQEENREVGSIGGHVYYEYLKAGAGPILFTITLFSTLISQD